MSKSSQESSPIRTILEKMVPEGFIAPGLPEVRAKLGENEFYRQFGYNLCKGSVMDNLDQAEAALNAYVEERVRKAFLEGKIDGFGEAAMENSLHENAPDFNYEIEYLTELLEAKHE